MATGRSRGPRPSFRKRLIAEAFRTTVVDPTVAGTRTVLRTVLIVFVGIANPVATGGIVDALAKFTKGRRTTFTANLSAHNATLPLKFEAGIGAVFHTRTHMAECPSNTLAATPSTAVWTTLIGLHGLRLQAIRSAASPLITGRPLGAALFRALLIETIAQPVV